MTTVEMLLENIDAELPGTRTMLERVPADQPSFKPKEKSFPLGKLAMHVAQLPLFGYYIVTEPAMDLGNTQLPHPSLEFAGTRELLRHLDDNTAKLRAAVASATEEDLEKTWKFSFGDHVIFNKSRAATLYAMFINHQIHHRAQIAVYLRLLDVKVPGMYGPSADEPFTP